MRNRTFVAGTALAAITVIAFFVLWRDSTKITGADSSPAGEVATASGPDSTPHPRPLCPPVCRAWTAWRGGSATRPKREANRAGNPAACRSSTVSSRTGTVTGHPHYAHARFADGGRHGECRRAAVGSRSRSADACPTRETNTAPGYCEPAAAGRSLGASERQGRPHAARGADGRARARATIPLPLRLGQGQARTIYFFTELRG